MPERFGRIALPATAGYVERKNSSIREAAGRASQPIGEQSDPNARPEAARAGPDRLGLNFSS